MLPMNLEQMKKDDIYQFLKSILMEFPISSIGFYVPRWTEMLKKDHPLKMELLEMARDVISNKTTMKDIYDDEDKQYKYITSQKIESVSMDSGEVIITVKVGDSYYYDFLSETTGMEIHNEYEFIRIMGELSKKKKEYEEVGEALAAVKQRGYGVVTPTKEEIVLEQPQIVKHGNKYGVKIKASAPGYYDLIFMDIMMPVMDGLEATKEIRRLSRRDCQEIPIIAMSANAFDEDVKKSLASGMNGHLSKPIDLAKFEEVLLLISS